MHLPNEPAPLQPEAALPVEVSVERVTLPDGRSLLLYAWDDARDAERSGTDGAPGGSA